MGVPRVYRKEDEKVLATFSSTELASGTGYVKYYGYEYQDETGTLGYGLTEELLYSTSIASDGDYTANDPWPYQTMVDKTFSTGVYNLPRTIRGQVLVNFFMWMETTSPDGYTNVTITLFDYDGSTATQLAQYAVAAKNWEGGKQMSIELPVSKTIIKKGHQVQVQVDMEYKRETDTNVTPAMELPHDPRNRDSTKITPTTDADVTTRFEVYLPYEIDT
jgi:hypothetical protein